MQVIQITSVYDCDQPTVHQLPLADRVGFLDLFVAIADSLK